MNSKKAITLLVLATLLMSILPILPVSAALTPTLLSGPTVYDEEITVTGTGVTPGATLEVYWDYVQPWNGSAGKVAAGKGKPSGAFEVDFDVPASKGGDHFVWVKDVTTGAIEPAGYKNVEPSLDLSSDYGLPGDDIDVVGYGFNASVDVTILRFGNLTGLYASKATGLGETDDYGTWDTTFEIPAWGYGIYEFNATANTFTCENATFRIGASISLNKEEGPAGTMVRITGRGFWPLADLTSAEVLYNDTEMYIKDSPVTTDSDGDFVLDAFIPGNDTHKMDEYQITVNGTTAYSAAADFEITGLPGIEADPTFQVQGGSFTLTGENYSRWVDQTVTVYLNETKLGTVKTKADGTWLKTFKVPAVTSGVYPLYAEMADFELNASINYRVGIMLVILSSESGATGSQVTLTATGFTEGGKWNMTIGDESVKEVGETQNVKSDGSITKTITIPTLPVGVQTVSVLDIDAEIAVETEFEVTDTSTLSADPFEVPQGFNVTLSGEFFTDEAMNLDLTFKVFNATEAWEITVWNDTVANIMLLNDGTFEGTWTVGDDVNLTIGSYTLNVTDGNELWAELAFNVVVRLYQLMQENQYSESEIL